MIYGNFVEEKLIIQPSFLRALPPHVRRRIAADASQLLHSFSAQIRHADDEHIYFGRIPPLSRQQQFFVSELFDVVFLRNLSSCYALHTTLLRRRAVMRLLCVETRRSVA